MILGPRRLLRRYLECKFRQWRQDNRGSAAVEIALVMPVLLLLLFAMIETIYMFFIAIVLEGATADASRQIRTGQVQKAGAPVAAFRDELCRGMSGVVDCADLRVSVRNFAQFREANAVAEDGNNVGNAFAPGNAGDIIVATVTYKYDFITPLLRELLIREDGDGARLISSSSAFRNEPFGD
jgi:Flp pilus assembly protein TadG